MKTLPYAKARPILDKHRYFVEPRRSATCLRCFQLYIETSNWDEKLLSKEHLLNKICLIPVILFGVAVSPFLIAILLK